MQGSCLPLEFSFAIAVFVGGSYRSMRVSGISSSTGRSCLPLEFSFAIAVFIGGSYRSIRVSGIPSGAGKPCSALRFSVIIAVFIGGSYIRHLVRYREVLLMARFLHRNRGIYG